MGRGGNSWIEDLCGGASVELLEIVTLGKGDDCGVYTNVPGKTGPYGTPLLFRGTEAECRQFIIGGREVIKAEDLENGKTQ